MNISMNIMTEALKKLKASEDSLGKMISQSLEKVEHEEVEVQRRTEEKEKRRVEKAVQRPQERVVDKKLREYHDYVQRTAREGLGSFLPCSLLNWKPPRPALANGKPCRIKWGLSDGMNHMVVVLYEYPQPLPELEGGVTNYGIHPVEELQPCDCRGYIHKRGCDPPRTFKKKKTKKGE